MKKILVILGHHSKQSLCNGIVESYVDGAKTGAEVKTLYLSDLKFDPILHEGYNKYQKPEKDLVKAQEMIKWAEHIVIVFPVWWFSVPALLKGFIDRAILPGFGFKYESGSSVAKQLLSGRKGRIIFTTGGPMWLYKLFGNPAVKMMKWGTLRFCGIKPVRYNGFYSVKKVSKERAKKIFEKARKLGEKDI